MRLRADALPKQVRTPTVVSATGGLRFRLLRARLQEDIPLCGKGTAVRLGPLRSGSLGSDSGSNDESNDTDPQDRLCNELDEITIHDTIGIFDVDSGRRALAGRMVHFQPHPFIPHEFEAVSIGRFCCESDSGSDSESGSDSTDDCTVTIKEQRIVPGEKCVTIEERDVSLSIIAGCLMASKSEWAFVEKLATCEALKDCCESDSGSESESESEECDENCITWTSNVIGFPQSQTPSVCGTTPGAPTDLDFAIGINEMQWLSPVPRKACVGDTFTLQVPIFLGREPGWNFDLEIDFQKLSCNGFSVTILSAEMENEDTSATYPGTITGQKVTWSAIPGGDEHFHRVDLLVRFDGCCCEDEGGIAKIRVASDRMGPVLCFDVNCVSPSED